jgi:hypothetical protein
VRVVSFLVDLAAELGHLGGPWKLALSTVMTLIPAARRRRAPEPTTCTTCPKQRVIGQFCTDCAGLTSESPWRG